jgi:death-on-curing protein
MSNVPTYLTLDEVIALHTASIERYGGSHGLCDRAALESAIAQPATAVFGVERYPSLAEKAAAYCFFIMKNHPFIDGNKRAGMLAALHFLLKNGVVPTFDAGNAYGVVLGVAAGHRDIEDLTMLFGPPRSG